MQTAPRWVAIDALLLVLLALAAFITISVFYPRFTAPAGDIMHGWLYILLGSGMYVLPVALFLVPAVVLPHRLRNDCARGIAWAIAIAVLVSLCGGLFPDSGWGGIIGDACARVGYGYLNQFYPALIGILALLVFARLAGRSVILPLIHRASDAAAQRREAAEQRVAQAAVAAPRNGKAKAGKANSDTPQGKRRAEVIAAEVAAADAPEGESPVIREPETPEPGAKKRGKAAPPAAVAQQELAADSLLLTEPEAVAAPVVAVLPPDAPLPPVVELLLTEPPVVADDFAQAVESAHLSSLQEQAQQSAALDPVDAASQAQGQLYLFPSTQVGYSLPPLTLLRDAVLVTGEEAYLEQRSRVIERTLHSFNVDAACIGSVIGPRVTRYELKIGPGINVSRIHGLADNLALELAVKAVRIEAPIPGMSAVGIEVPNAAPQLITLKSILETPLYQRANHPLTVGPGARHRRQPDDRQPGQDAARARRRRDGQRQERVPQRADRQPAVPQRAGYAAPDPDRPQARGDDKLRRPAAPGLPRGARRGPGAKRAEVGRGGDGAALPPAGVAPRAQHRDLQRACAPRPAAAVHRHRRRRAGRPDDARRAGDREADLPHRAAFARRGDPPRRWPRSART